MKKLNNDTIRPGVGVPLLDEDKQLSAGEGVLSEHEKEIIMEGAEQLIGFSNEDEGQSFNSPEEEVQYKEYFEDTEEGPDYEQQAYLRVELQNGEVDIYDNVDRMAADGGDQLLHLYREGEQVAFYQVRSVLKAAFSNEHY